MGASFLYWVIVKLSIFFENRKQEKAEEILDRTSELNLRVEHSKKDLFERKKQNDD